MKKVMEYKGFEIFKRSDGLFEFVDDWGSGHCFDDVNECIEEIDEWGMER